MNKTYSLQLRRTIRRKASMVLLCLSCIAGHALKAPAQSTADGMLDLSRANLCVTEGEITEGTEKLLSVSVSKMRAYATEWTAQEIEARFTYLGPTSEAARLGSGELRRQFGLKLRAQDACNLIYAVWRIEPESKLVVSVKSNPGQSTSAECTNHGYRNVKPLRKAPIPMLSPGAKHTLRAVMHGENLAVFIDGASVWEGAVGADVASLHGPVGIRSDNARLEIQLRGGKSREIHPDYVISCKKGPGESE